MITTNEILDNWKEETSVEITSLTKLNEIIEDINCEIEFKRKLKNEITKKIEDLKELNEQYDFEIQNESNK